MPSSATSSTSTEGPSILKSHIISDDLALIKDWKSSVVPEFTVTLSRPGWKVAWVHRVVVNQTFDTVSALLIILNAILLGVDTNWRAMNFDVDGTPAAFEYLEWLCTAWFLLELCLRILGNGCNFFFSREWVWNWFDIVVVASAVVERIMSVMTLNQTIASFTIIRIVRVLRVTRAIRVIRLLRFFQELRMMVMSVMKSSTSLTWSFIMLMTDMYLFSIFLTNNVADYMHAEGDSAPHADMLRARFGSIMRANYTLFQAIAGGISWHEISDPLFSIHWSNGIVFIFYIFFTIFALTNIITGVFVDTALQSAQGDREELIQAHFRDRASTLHQAKRFFEEASESGLMTLAEFEDHLKDTKARAHLAAIGIELGEARGLFRLLDVEESGFVTITDFISGCMRLKGSARTIDLATLMYENKRLHLQFKRIHRTNEKMALMLSNIQHNLLQDTHPPWEFEL